MLQRNGNDRSTDVQPTINHKPLTSNINTISDKPKKPKPILKNIPDDFGISDQVRVWAQKDNHQNLELHLERFIEYAKSNAKKYADWDSAFKRAIREDWGKVNKPVFQANGFNQQQPQNNRMENLGRLANEWDQQNSGFTGF